MLLGLVRTGDVGRRDFVCQICGAIVRLVPPRSRLLVSVMVGVPMGLLAVLALVGGARMLVIEGTVGALAFGLAVASAAAGFVAWALRPWSLARANPVEPGAAPPAVRFDLAEPLRRCGCGAAVPCSKVTRDRIGTECRYECRQCGAEFVVDDSLGTVLVLGGGALTLALGVAMASTAAGQGGGAWVCAGSVAFLGAAAMTLALVRVIARLRHPASDARDG